VWPSTSFPAGIVTVAVWPGAIEPTTNYDGFSPTLNAPGQIGLSDSVGGRGFLYMNNVLADDYAIVFRRITP
jgi:hypothetical protein